uniref:Methyltransf_21 domain-containing protein n=1 Tax=Steinernema glaseri TaxID=37863 RepID=A0A1I7Z6Q1_9BILA
MNRQRSVKLSSTPAIRSRRSFKRKTSRDQISQQTAWDKLENAVAECERRSHLNVTAFAALSNLDETKYHMVSKKKRGKCIVFSIGVGLDIGSEQKLRKLEPHCIFHGADPTVIGNKNLYETIGTFYPYAIGDTNGTVDSIVINGHDNKYRRENITTREFISFLAATEDHKVISQLFLDAEYAEFSLLKYFLADGDLERNDIVICQVNIEVHAPNSEQLATFHSFLKKMLKEDRYAIFKVFKVEVWSHLRIVLFNYYHQPCVDGYLKHENDLLSLLAWSIVMSADERSNRSVALCVRPDGRSPLFTKNELCIRKLLCSCSTMINEHIVLPQFCLRRRMIGTDLQKYNPRLPYTFAQKSVQLGLVPIKHKQLLQLSSISTKKTNRFELLNNIVQDPQNNGK